MKCNCCGNEMREGFFFTSKDGAFSFANEVPGVFTNAQKAEGFVKITSIVAGKRVSLPGYICEECHQVLVKYE